MINLWLLATVVSAGVASSPPQLVAAPAGSARTLCYTPDGTQILAAVGFGVRIFDAANGKLIATQQSHDRSNMITGSPGLAVRRDGRLAAYTMNDSLILVSLPSGERYRSLRLGGFGGPVAFSPDGRELAVLSWDGTLWFLREPYDRATDFERSDAGVSAAEYSPDGRWLLIAGLTHTGRIQVWNARRHTRMRTVWSGSRYLLSMALSHDGRWVMSQGDSTLAVLRTRGWGLSWKRSPVSHAIALSPDDRWIAAGQIGNGALQIFDRRNGRLVSQWLAHPGDGVQAVAFSPTGDRVVTSGFRDSIRVWDFAAVRKGLPH